MQPASPGQHYDPLTITLHWLMFGIFIAMYASIELRVLFAKGSEPREAFKAFHFMLGLLILLFAVLRISHRLRAGKRPAIEPPLPVWQALAASGMHYLLYLLMLGMPLLGWLSLNAAGKPIPWLGFELPALIGPDKTLGKTLKELHETLGQASYWLIGMHVAAALGHHYLQRDNTLTRMLPAGRGRPPVAAAAKQGGPEPATTLQLLSR